MGRGRAVAAAAVTAFALLLLLWGTGSGEPLIQEPQGTIGEPREQEFPAPLPTSDAAAQTGGTIVQPGTGFPWETLIIGLILLAVLVSVLRWLLNRDWEGEEPTEDEEVDDLDLLLTATSQQQRAAALAERDPRNAVVACWVAVEDAAERGGIDRDHAETSAEFTQRVLTRWSVDPATIAELAALYREARFSRHPVTEQQRDRALAAVEQVNTQLVRHRAASS
ncbi:MAG: DUF4129 domain-containing protein [Actinomycetota bacterium]|nr:DUF4129 domain-containing protein [Actinomycetota bacterium]